MVALLALAAVLRQPGLAAAQAGQALPELPRWDISSLVGVSGTREKRANPYDDWYHTWNGALSGGYYWTENLKTEVSAALTSEGRIWGSALGPGGNYGPVTHLFSTRSMTVAQHYQFGHNARFHPFLSAGVAIEWVRHTEERQPIYVSLRTPPYSIVVQPSRTIGPTTDVQAVPVIGGGFKGYFNERVFFRSHLGIGFRRGVRHVTVRSGFGVDF
jgi:outer membrane protein W